MNERGLWLGPSYTIQQTVALLCVALLGPGDSVILAQQDTSPNASTEVAKLSNEQLDSLVAPMALYPDPLLAQTLAASTYPLEIIQLQQWMAKHKDLKDKALADAVKRENWDPSVQAMSAFPDVVKQLADNIKWTSELGNAFLAQQSDVMDAVQRMRKKAKDNGNLKTTEQQKVETKVVESKTVVVIEPAKTEVIYVPSYNPTVVYGPPVYPYPPVYYPPPPPPGYYAAGMAISFGVGMAMGAAWGGGWGYGAGWGHNDINVNVNNTYVNNRQNVSNRQNVNNRQNTSNRVGSGNSSWQHNPQHRGGAPYSDRATASKYGGSARGDSLSSRQASARQQPGASNRTGNTAANRSPSAGTRDVGGMDGGSRGGERVGNRQVSSGGGSRNSGAFGGADSSSMSSARSSSQRGASSMGGSRGGGGGGGRGGGRRR